MDGPEGDPVAITQIAYGKDAVRYAHWSRRYGKFPGLRRQLRTFIERTDAQHPVLDAGCGAGRDSWEMVTRGRQVVSMDLCFPLLRQNSRDLGTLEAAHGKIQADLRKIPLASGSLGGIWACASLIHLPPEAVPDVLQDLLRGLRPNAPIWASFKARGQSGWQEATDGPIRGPRWFYRPTADEVTEIFGTAGFQSIRVVADSSEWMHVEGTAPG